MCGGMIGGFGDKVLCVEGIDAAIGRERCDGCVGDIDGREGW